MLGKPAGELVLRICGGEHDGRVLRIQAAKCLIGSGVGCTLRLRARHIRPVHVLILRGPQGSVVRCWSPDVLLNERTFEESLLREGDVLQIGPIALHVAELNQPAPVRRELSPNISVDMTHAAKPTTPATTLEPVAPGPRNYRASRRRKQLLDMVREDRRQQAALQQLLDEQQTQQSALQRMIDEQQDQQITLQRSIDSQKCQYGTLEQTLEEQKRQEATLRETIDKQQTKLMVLRDQCTSLQDQVGKLSAAADAAAAAVPANEALSHQLTRTIEQLQQELAAAAKRRTQDQQAAARQRVQFEDQLQQRVQAELDRQRAELQVDYDRQLNELRTEQAELHTNTLATERNAAATTIDQLRRELSVVTNERKSLAREIDSLRTAVQAKTTSEELARQSAATQIEQFSQAFELVRQERDELFQRLEEEQQLYDQQMARWQMQIDEARTKALVQVSQGDAASQKQLAIVRAELTARNAQLNEVQQEARSREAQLQDEHRRQLADLRAQMAAKAEADDQRRAGDSQKLAQLTATIEALRNDANSDAGARQKQQEGWTLARKRLEEEISALNTRLHLSDEALHEARQKSGMVQAQVLAEIERANAERDATREQILRQHQEWTEFRSRLEAAAAEERDHAAARHEQMQNELVTRTLQYEDLQTELRAANAARQDVLENLTAATSELDQLRCHQQALQGELFAKEEALTDLRSNAAHLQSEVESLRAELRTALQDGKMAAGELSEVMRNREELLSRYASLEDQRKNLQSELAQREASLEALRADFSSALQDGDAAVERIYEISHERDELLNQHVGLEEKIASLQADITRRDQVVESLVAELHSAQQAGEAAAEQLADVRQQLTDVTQQRDDLLTECQALRDQCGHLQAEVIERDLHLESLQSELASALQINQTKANEFLSLTGQQEELLSQYLAIQEQCEHLQRELTERDLRLEALQVELADSLQSGVAKADEFQTISGQHDKLLSQYLAVQEQSERLQSELIERDQRLEALQTELSDSLQSGIAKAEQLLAINAQNDDLLSQYLAIQSQCERFQADLVERDAREEALNARIASVLQEGTTTTERLAAISREYEQLAHQRLAWEHQRESLQSEVVELRLAIGQLQQDLAVAQEARAVAEQSGSHRLQQMTISMEQIKLDHNSTAEEIELVQAELEQERAAHHQAVSRLQSEVSRLAALLADQEDQLRKSTAESRQRSETAELQLQQAQSQVAEWQSTAQLAKDQCAELSQAIDRLRQQEKLWQMEREQLDFSQQTSDERLQQLESSITELQQQLLQAQQAVSAGSPSRAPSFSALGQENVGSTINVNNQELAALQEQLALPIPGLLSREPVAAQENVGSTINVNNQELAALHEQISLPIPGLLAPRDAVSGPSSAELNAKAAALEEQAETLALQQAQLEEEQATVARQRIELEQFQASLREMEQMLERRADEMQPTPAKHESRDSQLAESTQAVNSGEPDRESHPSLSESEAFAAMADQVAALYRTPAPRKSERPAAASASQHANEHDPYAKQGDISIPAEFSTAGDEHPQDDAESLIIPTSPGPEPQSDNRSLPESSTPLPPILAPMSSEDFENQLDERVARVMGRESVAWSSSLSGPTSMNDADATGANQGLLQSPEQPDGESLSQSDVVNNVLDRLREAGLWRGEGTAKADQFPSSTPPLEEQGGALCRPSDLGPIGEDRSEPENAPAPAEEPVAQPREEQVESRATLNLASITQPATAQPATSSLLQTPNREETEADDSIENYMSRLMQRLRTTDGEPSPDIRKSSNRSATSAHSRTTAAATEPPPPPKPVDSTPLTCLSELSPRTQAPEAGANLAAMRELANSAARGAIELHQKRSGKKRITTRTINTLLGVLVAAGLVFWWYRSGSWLAMGGAGVALLWALSSSLLAGIQSVSLLKSNGKDETTSSNSNPE